MAEAELSRAYTGHHAGEPPAAPPVQGEPAAREALVYLAATAVFAAAAWFTVRGSRAMRGGMEMPGNWRMSMMWMVMPGETSLAAAAEFAFMWLAMMVAMMLPSTLPILLLYRRAEAFRGEKRTGVLTTLVAAGYFAVWSAFGLVAYALGMAAARAAMSSAAVSRVVPVASGAALVLAGLYQLSPLKVACLKHCRDPFGIIARHLGRGARGAASLGLHHGAFCAGCCWALMLIQLVLGVMSLPVMTLVAVVIALEKLLARGALVARATGGASIAGGLFLAARSLL